MPDIFDIPDEYVSAIGKVVVRWNHLEFILNLFLIHTLGKNINDNRSHVVFAHMAFPQKLDVLGALAEELMKSGDEPVWEQYKLAVLPLLKEAQSGRNKVIHSIWGMKDGWVTRASISARGSFKFLHTAVTLGEIEATIKSIEDACRALTALASPRGLESI